MSHAIQTWLGKHRWYSSNDGIFRNTFVSFQGSKIRWRFLTCWFSLQVQKVEKIANTVNPPVTYCSTTSKNQLSILWICQSQNDYRLEHEPLDFETKNTGTKKYLGSKLIFRISPFKTEYTWWFLLYHESSWKVRKIRNEQKNRSKKLLRRFLDLSHERFIAEGFLYRGDTAAIQRDVHRFCYPLNLPLANNGGLMLGLEGSKFTNFFGIFLPWKNMEKVQFTFCCLITNLENQGSSSTPCDIALYRLVNRDPVMAH